MTVPKGAPSVGPDEFLDRLTAIRQRIAAEVADPTEVTLVAVTKGFGPEAVRLALDAGLIDVGENYADELVSKAVDLSATMGAVPEDVPAPRWHFLGSVQRNKVPRLAPWVACWQGIARVAEGRAIAQRHPGARVLVQVDIAGIAGRGGVAPSDVAGLVETLRSEPLDVAGLMAVGPPGPPEAARAGFELVSTMADDLGLAVRSMGMTDDLEVALASGSTMIRVGRALFGPRPPRGEQ